MTDEHKVCVILHSALMTAQIGGMSLQRAELIEAAIIQHFGNLEPGAATVLLEELLEHKDDIRMVWIVLMTPAEVGGMATERSEAVLVDVLRCDQNLTDSNRQTLAKIIEQTAKN